jgi:DUF971 family protein
MDAATVYRELFDDTMREVTFTWALLTDEQREKVKAWHREQLRARRAGMETADDPR